MASFESRPNGKTRARIRLMGVKDTKEFARKSDARAWAAKRETEIREGRAFGHTRKTLSQAIAKYRAEELPKLAATERKSRGLRLIWWDERLGPEMLVAINRPLIQSEIRKLREKGPAGRAVSFATGNRYKAAIGAVLSCAVEDWHWLPAHPLRGGGRRKRAKSEHEVERERELSADEKAALWKACRASSDPRLYALVVCAYYSGAREGELMSIERGRLQLHPLAPDPDTGKQRPGVPRAEVVDTKNGESRMLYFPGDAAEVLREMAQVPRLSRYLFAGPEDSPDQFPIFPLQAWRAARREAGIKDLRFHDLRHCWACNLLDKGRAKLSELMILGGWKSSAMVRRYAKRAQREGSAPVELLDRLSRT